MLEVEAIVKDLEIAKKEAKNMGRLAICIAFISVLVCAALLGLMFAANGTTIILGHSGLTDCI